MHSVYRHANNQKIDQYIQKNRIRENAYFYKKGSDSAKNMIKALKNNEDLALLVDQRDSSGPIINFLENKHMQQMDLQSCIKISNYDLPSLFN